MYMGRGLDLRPPDGDGSTPFPPQGMGISPRPPPVVCGWWDRFVGGDVPPPPLCCLLFEDFLCFLLLSEDCHVNPVPMVFLIGTPMDSKFLRLPKALALDSEALPAWRHELLQNLERQEAFFCLP